MKKGVFLLALLLCSSSLFCQKVKQTIKPQFEPTFKEWLIEDQSGEAKLTITGNTLEIVAPKGLTLWFNSALKGNYRISYQAMICDNGKKGDRLSDLNCFWAASDPLHGLDLSARREFRTGPFSKYDCMNLYYAGYGGNQNTTTRFRKYHGSFYGQGEAKVKPLLQEYTDPKHLLKPNTWYKIEILVQENYTSYTINGEKLFELTDPELYSQGYFGFRTTTNRSKLKELKIELLRNTK